MKKQEFFDLMEQYGINLDKLSITIENPDGWEGSHGIYEENGQWFYYYSDGRNQTTNSRLECEEDAFDRMLNQVFADLRKKGYITLDISKDVVKIPKDTVCRYIRDTYALSEAQAEHAWNKLKQDMHVLFEFKHYVASGAFIPEQFAYKVRGHSAEQLYRSTYLEVLGAFNYLIYLGQNPKEALENLKKGLPRRKVFTEAELKDLKR